MASNRDSSGEPTIEGREPSQVCEPPPNWPFNIFLHKLAEKIKEDEFKSVKHIFTGIIEQSYLDGCQNIIDIFNIMRKRTYLSNYNLLYVQSLMYNLRRPDLLKMCIDYANRLENIIHFYSPQEQPADGFQYVRIHVKGFKNISRHALEDLRRKVAMIVFIPEKDVIIAGVEPSSSMLFTLMIPTLYADIMQEMLVLGNENLQTLQQISVDVIEVYNKQYNIGAIEESKTVPSKEQTKLVNVYQQLQTTTKQLEDRELECLLLSKKINVLKEGNLPEKAKLSTFSQDVSVSIPRASEQIVRQMGSEEKQRLIDKYKWDIDDPLTEALGKETSMFLFILFLKELEQSQSVSDLVEFFTSSLEEVGRNDLVATLNGLLKQSSESASQKQGKTRAGAAERKISKNKSPSRNRGSRDSKKEACMHCRCNGQLKHSPEKYMFSGLYPGSNKRYNPHRRQGINKLEQAL